MNKKLMNEPVLIDLANHYHKSKVQIILRWHFQKGNILIPGSRKEEHILANKDIFDFELTKEDMESISKLNKNKKFLGFPSWLSKLLLPRFKFNFDKQK